ncbi:MAG: YlbF family regulator [Clostridiales Family XIII bacterium]|jgi:cell fate (sporulation/competence/biofilm development) regulator YlbF (YheA/YmcA/DUF963 family)|nr:YlbF family regulator [Clostridiales Family XIII bacterium]
MTNIHDMARELANAIRSSDEYKTYIAAKEKASKNPELANALNDFREKQFELQRKQLAGDEIGSDLMERVREFSQILMKDPLASEYLQSEIRFTLMVNDVYSILAEAVKSE